MPDGCVAMSWRDFGECAGWHLDVVQVASEAQEATVELAMRVGRVHEWVVDQSECGHPSASGHGWCLQSREKVALF